MAPLATEQAPCPANHRAPRRREAMGRTSLAARRGDRDAHEIGVGREKRLGARRRHRLVDDATVFEEDDAVGPRGKVRVVGDDDRGDALLAGPADHLHHCLSVRRVERARRLVGEQEVALADDGAGDRDSLAFSSRELVREVPSPLGDPDVLERGHRERSVPFSPKCHRARAGARRSRAR